MRTLLMLCLFTASLVHAAWGEFTEERELTVDASGISALRIDAAAGALKVTGEAGRDDVLVVATIRIPGVNDDKAQELMASSMQLSLERNSDTARLVSGFDDGSGWFRDSPTIDLEVIVPRKFTLTIDDSSGPLSVETVDGDIRIDDNSGSITVNEAGGNVTIDDGSGSIDVTGVGQDLEIADGSGSIKVRNVGGSVMIDDGSGSIRVADVEQDLVIVDDGSGSVTFSDVRGTVDDRS